MKQLQYPPKIPLNDHKIPYFNPWAIFHPPQNSPKNPPTKPGPSLGHPHRRCSTTRRGLVEKGVGVMMDFVGLGLEAGGHIVNGLDVSKNH